MDGISKESSDSYNLKYKDSEYTIPKENIVMLALHEALQRGIERGPIHDSETAIAYLRSIGFEVTE